MDTRRTKSLYFTVLFKSRFWRICSRNKIHQRQVKELNIEAIRTEFDGDNDYQSIQKIKSTADRLQYKKEGIAVLEKEMKELFLVDEN